MHILIVAAVSILLIAATILIHYQVLRFAGRLVRQLNVPPHPRVLVVIAACFAAHFLEITLYAGAYAIFHERGDFGQIIGEFEGTALDFFYFSITSYSTHGIGDVYPVGPLRLLAGIEALNGFLLITWSASFTYLTMQEHWHPKDDD